MDPKGWDLNKMCKCAVKLAVNDKGIILKGYPIANRDIIKKFKVGDIRYRLCFCPDFDYSKPEDPEFILKYTSFGPDVAPMTDLKYYPTKKIKDQNLRFFPSARKVHKICVRAIRKLA